MTSKNHWFYGRFLCLNNAAMGNLSYVDRHKIDCGAMLQGDTTWGRFGLLISILWQAVIMMFIEQILQYVFCVCHP